MNARSEARVGRSRNWKSLWPKKRVSRLGASRKSRAFRDGGRVHDDQVETVLLGQLVELLHRHVLLGARERFGQVPVDPVLEDALGLLGGVGVLADEIVEGALRVELKRPELSGP